MNNCKTCAFWNDGYCELPEIQFRQNKNPAADIEIKVDVADDTGLWVNMKTGPDFGCVHHTEKPVR